MTTHRAGFAAIVGRPNVGKSTLFNRLLGEKLAIVSPKPQTTRNRLLGVLTKPDVQVAFLDTPGLHAARGGINKAMVEAALGALGDVDVALHLIEANDDARIHPPQLETAELVARANKPTILVVNKIDRIAKPRLLPLIAEWAKVHAWLEVFPLSAQTGENVPEFVDLLARYLPEGPELFPPDVLTDQAERSICAEYVREQLIRLTHDEVPYGLAVEVEEFDESDRRETGGLVRIAACVLVERDSQKGIVIGKRGALLKEAGTRARHEIERLLGCRVYLALTVRVEKDWTQRPNALRRLGYVPGG